MHYVFENIPEHFDIIEKESKLFINKIDLLRDKQA
jgi:hypothetical protein